MIDSNTVGISVVEFRAPSTEDEIADTLGEKYHIKGIATSHSSHKTC